MSHPMQPLYLDKCTMNAMNEFKTKTEAEQFLVHLYNDAIREIEQAKNSKNPWNSRCIKRAIETLTDAQILIKDINER